MFILHIIQEHIFYFYKGQGLFYELINEVLLWVCLRCKLFLCVAVYYYEKATRSYFVFLYKGQGLFYKLINEVLLWVCLRCKLFLYVAFYYYEKATRFLQRTFLISNFHLWSYWLESISDTWCYWFFCNLFRSCNPQKGLEWDYYPIFDFH